MEWLQRVAAAAGGALRVLNGNHETMSAAGDFRCATAGGFAQFARWALALLAAPCDCGPGGAAAVPACAPRWRWRLAPWPCASWRPTPPSCRWAVCGGWSNVVAARRHQRPPNQSQSTHQLISALMRRFRPEPGAMKHPSSVSRSRRRRARTAPLNAAGAVRG